jgi:hypothetical protein
VCNLHCIQQRMSHGQSRSEHRPPILYNRSCCLGVPTAWDLYHTLQHKIDQLMSMFAVAKWSICRPACLFFHSERATAQKIQMTSIFADSKVKKGPGKMSLDHPICGKFQWHFNRAGACLMGRCKLPVVVLQSLLQARPHGFDRLVEHT